MQNTVKNRIKSLNIKCSYGLILFLFTIGFSFNSSFADSFLKIDGVDGESIDENHKDWINLISVTITQKELTVEEESPNVIYLIKNIDHTSAKLAESSLSGIPYPSAIIDICSDDKSVNNCIRYDFREISIVKYTMFSDDGNFPIEEIFLTFRTFEESSNTLTSSKQIQNSDLQNQNNISDKTKTDNVPDWIKTSSLYWVEGNVTDADFTEGIGFLVRENIIVIDEETLLDSSNDSEDKSVSEWIKLTTNWWINGDVPETEFLSSIKWLIENGIIRGVSN